MARQTSATIFALVLQIALATHGAYLGAEPKAQQTSQRSRKVAPLPLPLLPAEQAWIVTLDSPPSAGGAIDDDHVYIPLQDNHVQALDRENGARLWQYDVATIWAPVVRDGAVFITATDAVHALDARTGSPRWHASISRPLIVPLAAAGEILVGVMEPNTVVALAAADGRQIWTRQLDTYPSHAAASDGQRVIFALSNGSVVALSLVDGAVAWEQRLEGTLGPPFVAPGRVFVGSSNNYLYAFDERGRPAWKWRAGGDVVGITADTKGSAYYVSLDNVLRAVNKGNGNQRWIAEIPTRPALPPETAGDGVAYEEVVVVTGITSEIGAFSTRTGDVVGKYSPPSDIQGAPLMDGSIKPYRVAMVIVTRDGRAIGLRPVAMTLPEPTASPLAELPGRHLERDRPR